MKIKLLTPLAILTIATAVQAQYKPIDDGIAASPKVRQMLNERKAAGASHVIFASAQADPKCARRSTPDMSRQAKGAEILTGAKNVVFTRCCLGCDTKMIAGGEGKAQPTVAAHKCTAEGKGSPTCCASE